LRRNADQQRLDLARPRTRLACLLKDKINQLASGVGGRVVREMPHLPRGIRVLAENGEALADVGDVGVGVRLVGVAEDCGGFPARAAGRGGRRGWTERRRVVRSSPRHVR
jgi:hypothetical protein